MPCLQLTYHILDISYDFRIICGKRNHTRNKFTFLIWFCKFKILCKIVCKIVSKPLGMSIMNCRSSYLNVVKTNIVSILAPTGQEGSTTAVISCSVLWSFLFSLNSFGKFLPAVYYKISDISYGFQAARIKKGLHSITLTFVFNFWSDFEM